MAKPLRKKKNKEKVKRPIKDILYQCSEWQNAEDMDQDELLDLFADIIESAKRGESYAMDLDPDEL